MTQIKIREIREIREIRSFFSGFSAPDPGRHGGSATADRLSLQKSYLCPLVSIRGCPPPFTRRAFASWRETDLPIPRACPGVLKAAPPT